MPSDYIYTLLVGEDGGENDEKPDVAIGRMPVRTAEEARAMIDKIMLYDNNVRQDAAYLNNMLFLADDADSGGNFCEENAEVIAELPAGYSPTSYCLDQYLEQEDGDYNQAIGEMRSDIFTTIADNSAGIVNYRGHGAIPNWAGQIMNTSDAPLWQNNDRPTVIISADCLDTNFAWTGGLEGLAETFVRMPDSGFRRALGVQRSWLLGRA